MRLISKYPVDEYDSYVLSSLVVNDLGTATLYAEFYPCKYADGKVVLKPDIQGEEVKSISLSNIMDDTDFSDDFVAILESLNSMGIKRGIFQ